MVMPVVYNADVAATLQWNIAFCSVYVTMLQSICKRMTNITTRSRSDQTFYLSVQWSLMSLVALRKTHATDTSCMVSVPCLLALSIQPGMHAQNNYC